MKALPRSLSALLAAASLAAWAGGRAAENVAAQDEASRKSAAIWEESTRKKLSEGLDIEGGGDLLVGGSTLQLSSLKLRLGPLKTPGDLQGGQEPSELLGKGKGGGSVTIGGVSITAATTPEHVSGQTFEIGPGGATEIVMPDGAKWRFKDGGINFLHAGASNVHLLIEGHAIPVANPKAAPVRVTGELVAGLELLPARGAGPAKPKP
jgi:hypothetical protein